MKRSLKLESQVFNELIENWHSSTFSNNGLAEINRFLTRLEKSDFPLAVALAPQFDIPAIQLNYLAAMIETAADQKNSLPPSWVAEVEPLFEPFFVSNLKSILPHLLLNTPVAFRKRNIFIDSTIGNQV